MSTYYEPSDGDYNEDDYGKFFDDIQAEAGSEFGEYLEICTSLEEDNQIKVLGANDEGDEWIWEDYFPIPQGWQLERVQKMFEGNVYLKPSTHTTPLAVDVVEVCDCGEPFPESGYCKFCGVRYFAKEKHG